MSPRNREKTPIGMQQRRPDPSKKASTSSKPTMTLDRVLSRFGIASRSVARQAITAGRMKVNGRVVRDPDEWVTPDQDVFLFDGQRVKPAVKRYLLFYKPKGII